MTAQPRLATETDLYGLRPADENAPVDEPRLQGGSVSIWRSQRGERLWSVKVPLGANQAEVDAAIDIALAAEKRLDGDGTAR